MAQICVSGINECSGCGKCTCLSACSVCDMPMPEKMKYYKISEKYICTHCAERDMAIKNISCYLCGELISRGSEYYDIGGCKICFSCEKTHSSYLGLL